MKRWIGFSLALALGIAACTGSARYQINEQVAKKGIIKMTGVELNDKFKRKKWDMLVKVENLSDKSLLFFMSEMKCFKGETRGMINHAFFGAGERKIDLKPGALKKFRFVCSFEQVLPQGDFALEVGRIFVNPNDDGKTTGKIVANGLRLKVINDGRATR